MAKKKKIKTTKEMKEGADYIFDEQGRKVHPETGKQLKGFALNPEGINQTGRPKGSRNKSTLLRAQLKMDSSTEYAAELLEALMTNNKEFLGVTDDVPLTIRRQSALDIMNKSIANEKDKEPVTATTVEKEEENKMPIFSPVAVASNG